MIKVSNIVKKYGDITALNHLSLEIKDNTIFGLLGVNGAGKTTLLSILNGLIDVDEGKVEVFGLDMKYHAKEIKDISSIIPQHLAFYEKLTVKENLDFFSKIQKAKKVNYENALEINSLEPLLNQKAYTLSGGQKRRLNISIGLLNNPKIIYFDEPTVGVDPKSRNEILDSIKKYKELGITVVYTSHYMTEIEKICDEVAIINRGELVKQDLLDNLLSNRVSDKISVEIIPDENIKSLGIELKEKHIIETIKSKLPKLLQTLEQNNIYIKQIRYGASNLEKYFLEVTN